MTTYFYSWNVDVRACQPTNLTIFDPPSIGSLAFNSSLTQESEIYPFLLLISNVGACYNTKDELFDTYDLFQFIEPWFKIPGSFVTFPMQNWDQIQLLDGGLPMDRNSIGRSIDDDVACVRPSDKHSETGACTKRICWTTDWCRQVYNCLLNALTAAAQSFYPPKDPEAGYLAGGPNDAFESCLQNDPAFVGESIQCGVLIAPLKNYVNSTLFGHPCGEDEIGARLWNATFTDENLQTFITGGLDTNGVYWPGQHATESFSQALGGQLTKIAGFQCSLEHPCNYQFDCAEIGSWRPINLGTQVFRSDWGRCALAALQNINLQLNNQYVAIKGALGVLGLDTFSIDDFFPMPDGRFDIADALTGLGTIFSVVSGFVPVVGPGLAAAGAILPTVGSYLGNKAAKADQVLVGQREFAPKVRQIYSNYTDALDEMGQKLFKGDLIQATSGSFHITDMMKGGAWANVSAITKLTDLETNLTIEILSRSINALWKTPTTNKMWVLYVDLKEDPNSTTKCLNYSSGPHDSKYCADGGIYYTYNYIEEGDKYGSVGYPWGGNLLQEKLQINLSWVTEASAKSYQLAKKNKTLDPFNVAGAIGTETFLTEAVSNGSNIELLGQAGKYPGSWTLPVCNASTWGRDWNWDYTRSDWENAYTNPSTGDFGTSPKHESHPPCLCGENGDESDAWAKAAGMQDFETFHVYCKRALTSKDFQWPPTRTEVTYTGSKNYTIYKPGSRARVVRAFGKLANWGFGTVFNEPMSEHGFETTEEANAG
ncbi:MAG: hypothetical protein M1836_005439 [Candelina mexicana]|nr:MAG: hypothetical protein M1836_005439 [Candelina mexicana]